MVNPLSNPPDYGMLVPMSPLVARVTAKNPSAYTFTGTGTYIIGTTDLAIIDPGPMDEAHKEALLAAINNRPVKAILVTHTHSDHSTLAPWLAKKTKAQTYGFGPHGCGKRAGLEGEEVEAGADLSFIPDVFIKDGNLIKGDGWTIEAIHTPGHTSNHICYALKEDNAIFTGDHIMRWATTVISPPDGDMRAYLDSLKKIMDRDSAILYPTHGKAVTKPYRYINALIGHRRQREHQIIKMLSQGHTQIMDIVQKLYKDVDPRLHIAASRSVFSHLIMLVEDGSVTTTSPLRIENRFYLTNTP